MNTKQILPYLKLVYYLPLEEQFCSAKGLNFSEMIPTFTPYSSRSVSMEKESLCEEDLQSSRNSDEFSQISLFSQQYNFNSEGEDSRKQVLSQNEVNHPYKRQQCMKQGIQSSTSPKESNLQREQKVVSTIMQTKKENEKEISQKTRPDSQFRTEYNLPTGSAKKAKNAKQLHAQLPPINHTKKKEGLPVLRVEVQHGLHKKKQIHEKQNLLDSTMLSNKRYLTPLNVKNKRIIITEGLNPQPQCPIKSQKEDGYATKGRQNQHVLMEQRPKEDRTLFALFQQALEQSELRRRMKWKRAIQPIIQRQRKI